MNIEITLLISLAGLVLAYLGYRKGTTDAARESGESDGTMKADIKYIKRLNEDILLEQRDTKKVMNKLAERVTRNEESIKNIYKRLDG